MTVQSGTHPKKYLGCEECGDIRDETNWQPKRRLPQVGQTYECSDCGHEVYVYDATEPPNRGENKQWRPVETGMLRGLLFFDAVGQWPRGAFDAPMQSLPEAVAIDYWMVQREGWSQSDWADAIAVSQQAVSKNVNEARKRLDADAGDGSD